MEDTKKINLQALEVEIEKAEKYLASLKAELAAMTEAEAEETVNN